MNKYLLTCLYLFVMLAIYHHPIVLPNEGTSIPTGEEQITVPDNKADMDSENYVFETMAQKSAFSNEGKRHPLQILISQNEQQKTY